MRTISRTEHVEFDTERLVRRIPFFNDIYESSPVQFAALVSMSEIISVEPSETIIHKGDTDAYAYFLLKGILGVYLDDKPGSEAVNYIGPGEVFGILSMMTQTPRSAYIRASSTSKDTLLFKLDHNHMTDESACSTLSLETKLIFYRMALHNIRWTLEKNKMSDPDNALVDKMRMLPVVNASKGTKEELEVLKEHALKLSDILFEWNNNKNT